MWQRIGLFKHGQMEQPPYAYAVFKRHFDPVKFERKEGNFTCLELGPGDSLFSALVAYAFGASSCYLVDAGRFAKDGLQPYKRMTHFLGELGHCTPDFREVTSVDDVLRSCNARYETRGVESLKDIPEQTVDFVWSHAVLEHVRRDEFLETMAQLRRILRKGGVCSHRIDLMDHIGGALNNLRFSTNAWESDIVAHSGFYTNRIRYTEMLDIFKAAGFHVRVTNVQRWEELPTPRNQLSKEFRGLPTDDLLVYGFDVTLTPQ